MKEYICRCVVNTEAEVKRIVARRVSFIFAGEGRKGKGEGWVLRGCPPEFYKDSVQRQAQCF